MIPLNTIQCRDCLTGMREIPDKSIDLVITDPPYGIKRDKGFEGFEGFGGFGAPIARKQYDGEWDSERPPKEYFDEIQRISKNAIIFGGNFFTDILPQGNHWIVWDKQNTMPTFGDCELAWTNFPRNSVKLFTHCYNGLIGKERDPRTHPTQKPVKLFEWIIKNYAKEGDTICDPFFGSGSCLVAAVRMGHQFIGFEKELSYFEKAQVRIKKAQEQGKIGSWFE